MPTRCAPAAFLIALAGSAALAQGTPSPRGPSPVIACASLANLRMVLKSAKDDPSAAVPIVTDPKSDLGCSVLDRAAVTGIADHLALNGRAYDCLGLQNTSVCHWTVAGAVKPGERPSPGPRR